MLLTTFTPLSGPRSGYTYTLPFVKEVPIYEQQYGSVRVAPARGFGQMSTAGTAVPYPKGCLIHCTFVITGNWLINQLYPATPSTAPTIGDCETAIKEFSDIVLNGGMGALVATPGTGTLTSKHSGVSVTSVSTQAVADGSYTVTRREGGTSAEIEMSFFCLSGQWTFGGNTYLMA